MTRRLRHGKRDHAWYDRGNLPLGVDDAAGYLHPEERSSLGVLCGEASRLLHGTAADSQPTPLQVSATKTSDRISHWPARFTHWAE